MCTSCNNYLSTNTGSKPPPESIADSWVFGNTCDLGFKPFNRVDELLLSLDYPVTYVTTAVNGINRVQKYHNFVVKNTSGAPIKELTEKFNPRGKIRITTCGPNTDLFKRQVLKYFSPDMENDKAFYKFCLENNKNFYDQPDISSRFEDTTLAEGTTEIINPLLTGDILFNINSFSVILQTFPC